MSIEQAETTDRLGQLRMEEPGLFGHNDQGQDEVCLGEFSLTDIETRMGEYRNMGFTTLRKGPERPNEDFSNGTKAVFVRIDDYFKVFADKI